VSVKTETPTHEHSGTATAPRLNVRALVVGLAVAVPVLLLLVVNLGRDPHSVRSPLIGRPAPPFTLPPVEGGSPIALESLRGKPVVLNFWATWCVPCYQEHPTLNGAARAMKGEVQFLGVVYEDEVAKVEAFLAERGNAYPSLLDEGGRTAIAYGVYGVPETYFIDPAGRIVEKYVGPLDPGTIARLVARAKAGAP
jgi:cytochrome c biogenesis protein CcmG/thiol:disulfide interchange protein DsbE